MSKNFTFDGFEDLIPSLDVDLAADTTEVLDPETLEATRILALAGDRDAIDRMESFFTDRDNSVVKGYDLIEAEHWTRKLAAQGIYDSIYKLRVMSLALQEAFRRGHVAADNWDRAHHIDHFEYYALNFAGHFGVNIERYEPVETDEPNLDDFTEEGAEWNMIKNVLGTFRTSNFPIRPSYSLEQCVDNTSRFNALSSRAEDGDPDAAYNLGMHFIIWDAVPDAPALVWEGDVCKVQNI